jgi:hypothetical protein
MANKNDKEIQSEQLLRDTLILDRIVAIYEAIRDKSRSVSKSVTDKAGKDRNYFNTGTRATDFQKEFSETIRPDYVKRDAFSKKVYTEEYNTAYFQAKFSVENTGIAKGFDFDLPGYTDKQFKEARDYALSKLMNKSKMTTGRNLNIAQLEDIIVSGVQRGLSLRNINKDMDIAIGFRDSAGKWVDDAVDRKKQFAQTQRILRTEILRMRENAETDLWINSQDIVESKLIYHVTFSNTARNQSVSMNGQEANKQGQFQYPQNITARIKQSGVAEYDINCKCFTTNEDPEYPQETMIARNPQTGKNEIIPYTDFKTWAKDHDLTHNIYGQWLGIK